MAIREQALCSASFAVRLVDRFSGQPQPVGSTTVFITATGEPALRNPSGYHVFMDLTETEVTVRIENRHYHPVEVDVDIAALDARNPVIVQTLTPNYIYPFPQASTLVRGIVRGPGPSPVQGARVRVAGTALENVSEADGRFVLFWGPLGEDDISVVGLQRYVTVAGSTTITLDVTHPSFQPTSVAIGTVLEAHLTLMPAPIVLNP